MGFPPPKLRLIFVDIEIQNLRHKKKARPSDDWWNTWVKEMAANFLSLSLKKLVSVFFFVHRS